MSAERDTRVETLEAGDRVRWLHCWYTVALLQFSGPTGARRVAVITDDEPARTFLFPVGHFVAAECGARSS